MEASLEALNIPHCLVEDRMPMYGSRVWNGSLTIALAVASAVESIRVATAAAAVPCTASSAIMGMTLHPVIMTSATVVVVPVATVAWVAATSTISSSG